MDVPPSSWPRSWKSRGLTFDEKRMLQFIVDVTDRPGWHQSINNGEEIQSLRALFGLPRHAANATDGTLSYDEVSFASCLRELQSKAMQLTDTGICEVLDAEFSVVQSDSHIPESLRQTLQRLAIQQAEASGARWDIWCILVPDAFYREWWGVQNVLDPFMYPAIRNQTTSLAAGRVGLDRCWTWVGQGTIAATEEWFKLRSSEQQELVYFQLLPCEVCFSDGKAQITSYINGLHPRLGWGYKAFEDMLDLVIPLWEQRLGSYKDQRRILLHDSTVGERGAVVLPAPRNRRLSSRGVHSLREGLRDETKRLQVIFQMENVASESTFKDPDDRSCPAVNYSRGHWRRPGPFGEPIAAVAIYCYDLDDEADVRIQFSHETSWEHVKESLLAIGIPPHNETWDFYSEIFKGPQLGEADDEDDDRNDPDRLLPQDVLGSIRLRQGRLVVFPACIWYRIQVCEVPWKCSFLTMFLVDPKMSALSTAVVPPQSRDWWHAEVRDMPWFKRLPEEVWHLISLALDLVWNKDEQSAEESEDPDACPTDYIPSWDAWEIYRPEATEQATNLLYRAQERSNEEWLESFNH